MKIPLRLLKIFLICVDVVQVVNSFSWLMPLLLAKDRVVFLGFIDVLTNSNDPQVHH